MQDYRSSSAIGESRSPIICFRQPFSEKYTVTIATDIVAGHFPIQTTTQIRWSMRVIDVNAEGQSDLELITVENRLVSTNNPNLHELAALNQAFARMYSEIRVKLDRRGNILEVINLPVILSKWEQTKAEMQTIEKYSPALQDVIQLNEEIFATPEQVKLAIRNNEFFNLYFHLIYGERLPLSGLKRKHKNLFNSTDVNWQYHANISWDSYADSAVAKASVIGTPFDIIDNDWAQTAYKHFATVDLNQLTPYLSEKGEYYFHLPSGKLLEATLVKEENANDTYLRGKITYRLISDTYLSSVDGLANK